MNETEVAYLLLGFLEKYAGREKASKADDKGMIYKHQILVFTWGMNTYFDCSLPVVALKTFDLNDARKEYNRVRNIPAEMPFSWRMFYAWLIETGRIAEVGGEVFLGADDFERETK